MVDKVWAVCGHIELKSNMVRALLCTEEISVKIFHQSGLVVGEKAEFRLFDMESYAPTREIADISLRFKIAEAVGTRPGNSTQKSLWS